MPRHLMVVFPAKAMVAIPPNATRVIPAKAGIQCLACTHEKSRWIPAFAGMTRVGGPGMSMTIMTFAGMTAIGLCEKGAP
ncbi:hypothetical protein [Rhodanobacter sp. PCA2]|uniref:hypothetical protein n=1 Tax=Rhodanobacter sp. PCA2 TaxID=2006117 RepID=UPI0015E69055|nr:hypothetical protein [Rhodanobacter sp. PCA2]